MRRDQLEHAIRTACQIIQQPEVIVVGSQAILGTYDESQLPAEATMSIEVDILPIAESFLPNFPGTDGSPRALSSSAVDALLEHDWPGNVRELQNRIQRASLVAKGSHIEPQDLDLVATPHDSIPPRSQTAAASKEVDESDPEAIEIREALERASGVISRAAAELGLSRQALYRRMDRLGISVERRTTGRS